MERYADEEVRPEPRRTTLRKGFPVECTQSAGVNDRAVKPKLKLLLVDDSATVRFSLSSVLGSHGFEVVTAADVNEGLAAIACQKFDILLSDLQCRTWAMA